jgi:GAF domain-containing protein
MTAIPIQTQEDLADRAAPTRRLEGTERQSGRLLDTELQRLVERAALLVEARGAWLAVKDPGGQALELVAVWSERLSGPSLAPLQGLEELARWVIRQQAPTIIADCATDPYLRALGLQMAGSLLAVPLRTGQQVLGALILSSPSIGAFGPQHLQLLEVVADLGALALFQARQCDAVAQQKDQLMRLLEVARGLGTTPNTRAIIGLAVSALRRLIPCEEAVVYRFEADTETLCGIAGWGIHSRRLADARIRVSDPQSVTAWVAQQRRPLLHAGGANGFVGRVTGSLLAHRPMELLAVPVVAREQLWGVITLARAAAFGPGDLRTMLTLSQLIAPALIQAR